jgi:hypothetical protein
MSGALVPVGGCRACGLPYRAEVEELLAGGMSFARVTLALADRTPPAPGPDELAAHAAGHLLPAAARRQFLTPRPPPADPVGALELSVGVLAARSQRGTSATLPRCPLLPQRWPGCGSLSMRPRRPSCIRVPHRRGDCDRAV